MRLILLSDLPAGEPVETYVRPFLVAGQLLGALRITQTPSAVLSITHVTSAHATEKSGFQPLLDEALDAYQQGEEVSDWPVDVALPSSAFLFACWRELAGVPYGRTISYSELARRAGNAKAIRASASACARNPVPLLIPCHRILAKDGGLGGFGWGVPIKRALLAMEAGSVIRRAA